MIYLDLFLGFLKVGCFSFGGAYGAIPLIRDVVISYGWLSDEMLTYIIAVSESTPGPIMVNLATYIGISQAGIYMVLDNCFGTIFDITIQFNAIIITVLLYAAMIGYKHFKRKNLSPIGLIILSAILGIILF